MNDLFAPFYEGFYPWEIFYIEGFSQDMYDSGTYIIIGWFLTLSSLSLMLLYYYLLSSYGKWYKRSYWLLWLMIVCGINYFGAYAISIGEMEAHFRESDHGSPYGFSEHFSFSMVNALWAFLFSVIFSVLFKWKSVRASRTPF